MATDYGREVWCEHKVRSGHFVSGIELVAQAYFRRLITPQGMLRGGEDESVYGLDLAGEIGKLTDESGAAALAVRIRNQLMLDERSRDVRATVRQTKTGPSVEYEIAIGAVTDVGPFTLVLRVADVTVQLLKVVPL